MGRLRVIRSHLSIKSRFLTDSQLSHNDDLNKFLLTSKDAAKINKVYVEKEEKMRLVFLDYKKKYKISSSKPRALFPSDRSGGEKSVCEGKEALGTRMYKIYHQ